MIDLERALFDVAEHLDHPAGAELTEAVRRRLDEPFRPTARAHDRSRVLVAAAAVLIAVVTATLAIPPARHAVADWLGIGAIEVRRSEGTTVSTGPRDSRVPGAPGSTAANVARPTTLAEARDLVDFEIATPRGEAAGANPRIEVDRRPQGGLVVLDYGRFTLVEVGADPELIAKLLHDTATVERVTVAGEAGLWIRGVHELAYQTRSGALETDTVRRSGPVLIWGRGPVTLRLEGFAALADAQKVAATIG